MMRYNGRSYLLSNQSYGPNEDARLTGERQALTSNGVVYGIFRARADLFSQARFVWKRYGAGPKPMAADVTTNTALRPVGQPGVDPRMVRDRRGHDRQLVLGARRWLCCAGCPPSGCRSFSAPTARPTTRSWRGTPAPSA
jgi:hypothetical protein